MFSVYKEKQFTRRTLDFLSANDGSETVVVHSFINSGLYSLLKRKGKKGNNLKVIVSYHGKGPYAEDLSLRKSSFFYSYVDRRETFEILNADIITFPSKAAMDMFIEKKGKEVFARKRLEVVYNGIDCQKIDSIINSSSTSGTSGSGKIRIVNVAAHVPQKRMDILIEVAKILKGKKLDFEIINIGLGSLLEKHMDQIVREGLDDCIRLLGKIPYEQVILEMARSDIFFLPSENVVFDLSTLEAMYCGLPVVVSRDGGNLEAIEHDVNGYLIAKGDINAFVSTLAGLIKDPEWRRRIGANAKKRIRSEFSMERMTEGYLELYKKIIN